MLKAFRTGKRGGDRSNERRQGLNEGITGMDGARETRNLSVKKQQRGKGRDGRER